MKYSEFETEVEGLGFNVKHFSQSVYVENQENDILAKVDLNARYMLSTHANSFFRLDEKISFKLYGLCMMLAETPPPEREEEKRYWLRKLPVPLLDRSEEKKWLWRQRGTDIVGVDTLRVDHEKYQTIFAESEIAQMDITGFKKEPVE